MRKTAKDFDRRVLDLFDGYVHGAMTKRDFLERAAKFTAGGVGALAVFEALKPNYALASEVDPNDPDIVTATIEYPSPKGHGSVKGLLAKPKGEDLLAPFSWSTKTAG